MTVNEMHEFVRLLNVPSSWWVNIKVTTARLGDGGIGISSEHTLPNGSIYRKFFVRWADDHRINTEYGQGISLIHDLKDHYFYGLGIIDLTELQTIVQTYYGREVSGGTQGRASGGDYVARIKGAIHDELFGPRGPRVYDPDARALLDIYAPDADLEAKVAAERHMNHICFEIMLPNLKKAYCENRLFEQLQMSTRDQPWLIQHYLPDIRWCDEKDRLMDLSENADLKFFARAYVNSTLGVMTQQIKKSIREYVRAHDLLAVYGKIFDTRGYSIIDRIAN